MYRKMVVVVGAIMLLVAFTTTPVSAGRWVSVTCESPGNTVVDYIHGTTHVDVMWYGDAGESETRGSDVRGGGKLTRATPSFATSYEAYLTYQGSSHRWYGPCS